MGDVLRNRLRELLDHKPSALGTFITLGDSVSVDLAGVAGFEFVVIECEHAGLSLETVQNHLRAARARGLGTLVRVPAGDHGFVQRVLDIGAEGVLVPHISDAAAAARAVRAFRPTDIEACIRPRPPRNSARTDFRVCGSSRRR